MKNNFEKERMDIIETFVRIDMKIYGYITDETREAAKIQGITITEQPENFIPNGHNKII